MKGFVRDEFTAGSAGEYGRAEWALHWLLAAVIIGMLIIGFGWLAMSADSDPQKIAVLRWHMAGGMLILALMLVRFVVRIVTTHPAAASTGSRVLDRFAPVVH